MDCGNDALNQFRLARNQPTNDKIQMLYTCASGPALGTSVPKFTPLDIKRAAGSSEPNGNTVYLDRHEAACPFQSVMTELKLNTNGDKWQWAYKCAPSERVLTYRDVATTMNDDGGGRSEFLDRHDVKCNSNEALTKIKLVRNYPTNNKYQFQYQCAS